MVSCYIILTKITNVREENISDLSPCLSLSMGERKHGDMITKTRNKIHSIAKEIASTFFNLSLTSFLKEVKLPFQKKRMAAETQKTGSQDYEISPHTF